MRFRRLRAAEVLLSRNGVTEPGLHAPDLVTLIEGLLMQRTVHTTGTDSEAIVRAYLGGIEHGEASD